MSGGVMPFGTGAGAKVAADPWSGLSVNTPQPQLLGARVALQREMLDLTFRRPNLSLDDGYFAGGGGGGWGDGGKGWRVCGQAAGWGGACERRGGAGRRAGR